MMNRIALLIHNYIHSTLTHRHTHTRMGIRQLYALGPPRRTSSPWTLPGRLVDEDGLRGLPLAQRGQVRGRAAWPSLCGSLFASRNRFTVDEERTACVLPVKSVTGLFATLFSKRECRFRKERAGSRVRCALDLSCSRQFAEHS